MGSVILSNQKFYDWRIDRDTSVEFKRFVDPSIVGAVVSYGNTEAIYETMAKLKKAVPQEYYDELYYCIASYYRMFCQIFPPLAPAVGVFAYIEWLMYTETNYTKYRDHIVHQYKTAFVCHSVYTEIGKSIYQDQKCSEHFSCWLKRKKIYEVNLNYEEIVVMGFQLASLFHDIGYGQYYSRRIKGELRKLYCWHDDHRGEVDLDPVNLSDFERSLAFEFILSILNPPKEERCSEYMRHYAVTLFCGMMNSGHNHSVESALFLIYISEELMKQGVIRMPMYIAMQIAAEAALLHDLVNVENSVGLCSADGMHFLNCNLHKKSPVAALLILADELACWHRPLVRYKHKKDGSILCKMDYSKTDKKIEIEISGEEIVIISRIMGDIKKKWKCFCATGEKDPKIFGRKITFKKPSVGDNTSSLASAPPPTSSVENQ